MRLSVGRIGELSTIASARSPFAVKRVSSSRVSGQRPAAAPAPSRARAHHQECAARPH